MQSWRIGIAFLLPQESAKAIWQSAQEPEQQEE